MSIKQLRRVAVVVPALSRLALEERAERFLGQFYPRNLQEPTYLDIISLLERLEDPPYHIQFAVDDLPNSEGETDPIEGTIFIDTAVYRAARRGEGRPRMTCAHEAGHIQHIPYCRQIIRDGRVSLARSVNQLAPAYCDPEWQASSFASALLMPRATTAVVYQAGGLNAVVEAFGVTLDAAKVRVNVLRDKNWL